MTETVRIPLIYSGRVRRALQLAEQVHRGTSRKSGDHPYLLHLVSVTSLLAAAGADDDMLAAGYLHDAAEDTSVTLAQIEDEFGRRVADLVDGVTKRDIDPATGVKLSKADMNQLTLDRLRSAPQDVCVLKSADLIANVSDLILDQRQFGYEHWKQLFGENADLKLGHYLNLADILVGRLADPPVYPLLRETLRERAGELRALYTAWQR